MSQQLSRRSILTAVALVGGAVVTGHAASAPAAASPPPALPGGVFAELPTPRPLRIATPAGVFDAIAAGPRHGRPVLFLHGFPETAASWHHHVSVLGALGFRAVAVDQRGYSPEVRPADVADYSFDALATDVADIGRSLHWDRFDLVGHDLGAAVAWVAAARLGEQIRSLTTLSVPHPGAFAEALRTDPEQQEASSYMDFLRQVDVAERELLADDAAMLRQVYTESVPRENIDAYVARLSQPGALTAALNWYRGNDFTGYEQPVAAPTLYIWGTRDDSIAPSGVYDTADWVTGDYRLKVLDGVGHFSPEEAPDTTAALLLKHLGRN